MSLAITAVQNAAQDLLNCVCSSLATLPTEVTGLDGCPCRVFVSPGEPAADGCDEGCTPLPAGQYPGQLTVHVVRTYPTTYSAFPRYSPSDPGSVQNGKRCEPTVTAVDLTVTLYRCVPLPSDQGCPPSPEDLAAAAAQTHADMMAILRGVDCCYPATDTTRLNGRRYSLGESRTVGPRGGCIGVSQVVTVSLDDSMCCTPAAP